MDPTGYNSVRATAALSVSGNTLSNDDVSRRLALAPDYAHKSGDRGYGGFRFSESGWGFRSRLHHNVPLAEHLQSLVDFLDAKRDAIRSIHDTERMQVRFSCCLINDTETGADFAIPGNVITWCSEALDIDLNCMPRRYGFGQERAVTGGCEGNEVVAPEMNPHLVEPDRAFAYLVETPTPALTWGNDPGKVSSRDGFLPRPNAGESQIVVSDLLEDVPAVQHLQRVLDLSRKERAEPSQRQLELTCLYAAERMFELKGKVLPRADSTVRLEFSLMRQMMQLGAGFRIYVYPTPSELKRLRGLRGAVGILLTGGKESDPS